MYVTYDHLVEMTIDDKNGVRARAMNWLFQYNEKLWKNHTTMTDKYNGMIIISFTQKEMAAEFKLRFG